MLSHARISLAENEPLLALELAQTILEAHGTIAAIARSREEAMKLAASSEINVAVLDVKLPDGKSFTFIQRNGSRFNVAVQDFATRQVQVLTDGGVDESPSFAPNVLGEIPRPTSSATTGSSARAARSTATFTTSSRCITNSRTVRRPFF